MKYLPILQEAFESDTIFIFLMIGLIISVIIGLRLREPKILGIVAGISLFVFAACELASNLRTGNFMMELILLFPGTTAMGCAAGFSICLIILLLRNQNESQ